ncbi:BNR repeat-containing protein [Mangrovimonas sp. DI 80]|uniref:BNR repeat-containing protein n=1 Tax=Mangrovimonas sp. DI 80 TaxID=1779330 RepID=UPI000977906B|nr:BNR repeat-containing protein [Mangrovimonas sp. DI 80]OMP30166.1 neuraminidase [Mangrovimonas sp. DI 80]
MLRHTFPYLLLFLLAASCHKTSFQKPLETNISKVGEGWAKNSINTVIFRKNSLATHNKHQYIAYYNPEGHVVLGKRLLKSNQWETLVTPYTAHVEDAHNSISIMVDGEGFLHVAWGNHNNQLNYAKSVRPNSLELGKKTPMLSDKEQQVSYPEFYALQDGNLLFFYRDGGSGNGNLLINYYNTQTQTWHRVQDNLIGGEGLRNAYWQAYVDKNDQIHISWVWRESPDVASNHDLAYATSKDGGKTWQKSTGEIYQLPITESSAEVIKNIPQNSELINQTSMTSDKHGNPFIVSYWREADSEIPQFHLTYKTDQWQTVDLGFRKTPFSLSGLGTKSIPISRPQIVATDSKDIIVIFRDEERGSKVSIAYNTFPFDSNWQILDVTEDSYEAWEPTLDTELWKSSKILSLFLQKTYQVDGEGLSNIQESDVEVLDWQP